MARQLNASCNFKTSYLICDIPGNMMEVVVKMKMTFGKHTLVKDRERRTVMYRPWGKHRQTCVRMETAVGVTLLNLGMLGKRSLIQDLHLTLGTGSTWNMILAIHLQFQLTLATPRLVKGRERGQSEVPFETHPKNNVNKNCDAPFNKITFTVPVKQCQRKKHPTQNKIQIDLSLYCPVCTHRILMHLPRTRIRLKLQPRRTPSAKGIPNQNRKVLDFARRNEEVVFLTTSPIPERKNVQFPSDGCMESDWDLDSEQVPDFAFRPMPTEENPKPLKRHSPPIRRPPHRWSKAGCEGWYHTPNHSPEYIPMQSPPVPKPSKIRKTILREARMRLQGWPRSAEPEVPLRLAIKESHVGTQEGVYIDPIDQHLYDEPKEEGEDRKNNIPQREEEDNRYYKPMEKETTV